MASKLVVSITNARNNPDSATVGFVVANAGVPLGWEVAEPGRGFSSQLATRRAFM
jgi:hypothetical protein